MGFAKALGTRYSEFSCNENITCLFVRMINAMRYYNLLTCENRCCVVKGLPIGKLRRFIGVRACPQRVCAPISARVRYACVFTTAQNPPTHSPCIYVHLHACGTPHGCCCVCSHDLSHDPPHPPTASVRLACWSAWVLLLVRPHGRPTAADPRPPLADGFA